jgi:uncharacterized protein (TIGR03067 family)
MKVLVRLILGVAFSVSVSVVSADETNEQVRAEMKKFAGVWEIVSTVEFGEPSHLQVGDEITFKGNSFSTKLLMREQKKWVRYSLDPQKRFLDYISPDDGIEWVVKGIYEFKGGSLAICFSFGSREIPSKRPTEMKSVKGDDRILMVLSRRADQ